MNHGQPGKQPSFVDGVVLSLRQELEAWGSLLREAWPFLALAIAVLAGAAWYARPLPPGTVHLAVGQAGSATHAIGERLVPHFAKEGVRLELVETPGSPRNLLELVDRSSKVSSALVQAGTVRKGAFPNIVSLGSLQYAPLWLFYRGEETRLESPLDLIAGKRVSIGAAESGTRDIVGRIAALLDLDFAARATLVESSHEHAAEALLRGELDVVCIADAIDAPVVQQLLAAPGVHVFDFALAAAYAKKLPWLDVVSVPRGSLDLKAVRPRQDVRMLASTTALLVEDDLHPVVQQLFLLAADQLSNDRNQFFAKPEYFPSYIDHAVPVSPVAKRFYEGGPPPLLPYLPLWLASFIDRMWLVALAAAAVIVPLFSLRPSYRTVRSEAAITEFYAALHALDRRLDAAPDATALAAIAADLESLARAIEGTWIAAEDIGSLYSLRSDVAGVRDKARERLARGVGQQQAQAP